MTIVRMMGGVAVAAGVVLACAPTLVHDPGPAPDLFEAIERHTRWGALIAVGAMLIARTQLKPWRITFAHLVLWLSTGYLVARAIGIALEGAGSGKQWLWFGIEVAIIAVAGGYLWARRDASKGAPVDVQPDEPSVGA